jgi:hypothetical protein
VLLGVLFPLKEDSEEEESEEEVEHMFTASIIIKITKRELQRKKRERLSKGVGFESGRETINRVAGVKGLIYGGGKKWG